MNKKWIAGVAVLAVSASLAMAAPNGNGWGGHRRGRAAWGHLAQKLNLTDAQKQQVRDLNVQFRNDNQATFQTFRQTRKDIRAAKQAGDAAKVDSLKATIASQGVQIKQLRDAQEQKFVSVLTPDQAAQYQALKAEREARREQRHQK